MSQVPPASPAHAGAPEPAAAPAAGVDGPTRSTGDMLFAMASKALYAVSRVALPPLTLAYVGLAEYGLWATCFVVVSYLGMTASGFTLVYLRRTSQHMAADDIPAVSRLLSTGILIMGTLALALLGGLWLALPQLQVFFNVDPSQRELARQLWIGTCAIFLADMSLGAFGNVLHAVNRVRQEQTVWVISYLLETLCIVGCLYAGLGIHGLMLAFGLRYLFACTANGVLVFRALPGLQLRLRHFEPALLKHFFGVGAAMQVSGLIATALHSADKVIAGAVLGPQATALFDLATKLPITAASAPSSVSGVAVSAAARHDARNDREGVRRVFADSLRMTVTSLGLLLPFMAAFSDLLTRAWLGASATQLQVAPVMMVLTIGLCWHMLTGPASAIFRGLGQLGAEFFYHGLRLTCFTVAGVAWSLLGDSELVWLAVGIAAAQTLASSLYLLWSWRRLTGAWHGAVSNLFLPMATALALAAALRWAAGSTVPADRTGALLLLAGLGTAWLVLFTALTWFVVLDPPARAAWRTRLARRFGSAERWRNA